MHVMIAIPAYTGVVHVSTMRSLFTDLIDLVQRGDRFTLVDDIGNALIADSRGVIATRFWESDCDCLVFVDNDVSWEKGALLRLIDAKADVVGGVYPMRRDPIQYLCITLTSQNCGLTLKRGFWKLSQSPPGL